jgi:hypothetical protein
VPKRSPKSETEIAVYERREKLLQMRREGHTFQSCADTLGYHDASHASKDYHAALKLIPADQVDMLRAEAGERIQFLYSQAMKNVLDPPYMHSAIGKAIPSPTRPGEFLVNESVRNSAIESCRKLTAEYLKVMGVPLTPQVQEESAAYAEMLEWVQTLVSDRKRLSAENEAMRATITRWETSDIIPAITS